MQTAIFEKGVVVNVFQERKRGERKGREREGGWKVRARGRRGEAARRVKCNEVICKGFEMVAVIVEEHAADRKAVYQNQAGTAQSAVAACDL